ncbi:Zinc finger protein SHOOT GRAVITROPISM 5-like protein [Drosera capensis]
MEEHQNQKELELLPPPPHPLSTSSTTTTSTYAFQWIPMQPSMPIATATTHSRSSKPPSIPSDRSTSSLSLQLSDIFLRPTGAITKRNEKSSCIRDLKCKAAEQIRLAVLEKKYAERVRESTRREMELARAEFAQARALWETAKEEMAKAEMLKESATRNIHDHSSPSYSSCLEITCQSCSQRFRISNA